jgi:hypothetical protein
MNDFCTRREWFHGLCGGLGSVGLVGALASQTAQAATPGHYAGPQIPARAKHVIFLFLTGGPSQLDMFDPKPALQKYAGQRPSAVAGFRTERETGGLLPSPFKFAKVDIYLTQVAPRCSMASCGRISAQPEGL